MTEPEKLNEADLTRVLAYAGFVLVAFELMKALIVKPIRVFYADTTFGEGLPFKSYEADVLSRHRNEFEACLLYLRDFMGAIDSEDVLAIQALRKHRNELAHDLAERLHDLDMAAYLPLLESADRALFKLSNYRTYIEIGHDPAFQDKGIDWDTVMGSEYILFKEALRKVRILQLSDAEPL